MKLWPFARRAQPPVETKGWVAFADAFKSDPQFFQKALDIASRSGSDIASNTAVYACVNILSQEIASLRAYHWRMGDDGTCVRVPGGPVNKVLRRPNAYQTASDFWLYEMRALLLTGNLLGVAQRNNKTEVTALHPRPPSACQPLVNPDNGDVFYQTSGFGDALYRSSVVPAENMLHVRINCNRHPLIGETPITALSLSALTGNSIQNAVARFHANMSRPSGVMMTPKTLTGKQINELREQFEQTSAGANVGKTPVLHSDLKWEAVTMAATDAETIASYNLTVSDIAMAYRVPLFMLGDLSKATFRNVETLFRVFYTSSLRFYLEHIENALNELFELDGEREYIEFDIESGLLRGDLRERMEALTKGVQGGIITPNEGRRREGLPPVKGGDDAFLQRQMVPISLISDILKAEAKRASQPPAPPPGSDGGDPADEEDPADEGDDAEDAADDSEDPTAEADDAAKALIARLRGLME